MADYEDVVMEGGKPWGIRMQGGRDTGLPLKIAQITPGSKASVKGIVTGMEILSINDNDTSDVSMVEAQFIIKGASDKLVLRLKKEGHGRPSGDTKHTKEDKSEADDQAFFDDLKNSCGGGEEDWSGHEVKGSTFKMLQDHIDAGQAGSVLSAFDKPCTYGERNASIRTTAPQVKEDDNDHASTRLNQSKPVILEGGKPWGIRLQGGKGTDTRLHVANVQEGSKAYHQSLLVGDHITSINGHDTTGLTMADAQNLIKETGNRLSLEIISVNQPGLRVEKADDEKFFNDLKDSVKGGTENWSHRKVKGGAFKMLQNAVDSGHVR